MSYFFTGDLITSNASTLLTESKGIAYRPVNNGHETILRGPKTGNASGVTVLHLPGNTGTSGQVLQTDGTGVLSFATGGGIPAGLATQLQYNNGGSFGAIEGFTYNNGTDNLLVNTALSSIVATNNSPNALAIVSDGGTLSTLQILNNHGENNAAIELTASAGGITAKVADEKELTLGNTNGTTYFKVAASGTPANEDIRIVNANGTNNAAIELTATAGGITAKVADGRELTLGNANGDAYFKVAASGTPEDEDIRIVNTNGTDNAAIELTATAGGIDMDAAIEKNINISGGQVALVSKDNVASAISLTANQGPSETIVITNTQGTLESALTLTATYGGIDMDAAIEKNINISGGQVALVSKDNAPSAISLTANQGINETIVITNTQGTGNAAIELTANAGGITLYPGTAITTSNAFITTPHELEVTDITTLHHLIATTNNAVYLNLTDLRTSELTGTDTGNIEVIGSNTAGQNMHLFFDNVVDNNNLRLDFGNNLLTSGSGLARYLTFSDTGQSASLMYVGSKWRIINTGAAVS